MGELGRNPNHYPRSPCGSIPFFAEFDVVIKRLSANEGDEGHEGHVCFFHILEGHEGVKAMNPMKKLKVLLFILLEPES